MRILLVLLVVAVFAAGTLAKKKNKHKACHYKKGENGWSKCVDGKMSIVKELKAGSESFCLPQKEITKKCGKTKCKYSKAEWSECDAAGKQTRTMTLLKGQNCEATKIKTRDCRTGCKYEKGDWSKCDPETNKRTRTLTLVEGGSHCEQTKTREKTCRKRGGQKGCRYDQGEWQECDLSTNTMTKTLTLISGDPEVCAPTKEMKRKCRKPCKFRRGPWSDCDPSTNLMTRVDKLVKGDDEFCSSSREITKKCGKGNKCQYDIGAWSDCDQDTNKRTRTKTLKKGDPNVCEATIVMEKACSRPNGKERCFFGKWGDYGPCMNGVMTKTRELIQGGTECERKAVKTKACS